MKNTVISMVVALSCLLGASLSDAAPQEPVVSVSDFALAGEIDGENIVFTLSFRADVKQRNTVLPLVVGDVAYLDGKLPKHSELLREGDRYLLRFRKSGKQGVTFSFASRAAEAGDWRRTGFQIPVSTVRKLSVLCDRDDLEVRFPGALEMKREKTSAGKTQVTAYLGITGSFEVQWKPEVRKLDAELVVTADANTIATASVGALRLDTIFTYRVIQGMLQTLVMELPDVNVTQVRGKNIQDWRIDRTDPARPRLLVTLSRPTDGVYRLQVESEMILPKFPCSFVLPVLRPRDVIRASGFLLMGADSAIKLQVNKAGGLTQVDQASFPRVSVDGDRDGGRAKPSRSTYAYQYASTPYVLELEADDIVTSYAVDYRLVLSLEDNELVFEASVEIDIKDAAAREIYFETTSDPEWTVTGVTGKQVSEADTDVREEDGRRVIYVPFKEAVTGQALITVRMEKSLAEASASFEAPAFAVSGAKSERGYLVVAAERGVRLRASAAAGLREVHTGSAPIRVSGAQQAFRFKQAGWTLAMDIERTMPALHAEVFHLVSLGEGVMYCSAAITYHIGGAPLQEFKVRVPKEIETVEFTGADIEGWTREEDVCKVRIQTRVMGDYTLLVTYDRQFDYEGSDIAVADVETIGTESEVGYVAVASSASLKLTELPPLPPSIIVIDRDEIPTAYSSPVTDPIIRSYKYVRTPHRTQVRVEPLETEQLLGQVADYVKFSTALTKDGEAVTKATYYIKNASRQHLVVALPKGVKLWSIKLVNDDGTTEDVLSQESEEGVLIPVTRPRDPNTAIRLEVVFAESHGKLGFWRSGLMGVKLLAPRMPDTHATFADWTVTVPDRFALAGMGGNMSARDAAPAGGLGGVLGTATRIAAAIADGPGGRRVWDAVTRGWDGARERTLTRTVSLAGEEPLRLNLQIVPRWIGGGSAPRRGIVAVVLGLAVMAAGIARKKGVALIALGGTVVLFGIAQSAAGRSVLAVILVLAVALFVIRWGVRIGWRLFLFAIRVLLRVIGGTVRALSRGVAVAAPAVGRLLAALWKGTRTTFGKAWNGWRESRERAHLRKLELKMAVARQYAPPPFETEPGPADEPENGEGYVRLGLLSLLAGACLLFACIAASASKAPVQVEPHPVMDMIDISVEGPGTGRDVEQSAEVKMSFRFTADDPVGFIVIPAGCVLTHFDLGSRYLRLQSGPDGYLLNVIRKGDYDVHLRYRTPVGEKEGTWSVDVPVLENMRNRVRLTLPEPGLEIRAESAVLFRTEETEKTTEGSAVFGPVKSAAFTWRPRVRKTMLEKAVFFCEVNSHALLRPGLVELSNLIRYQVAQGEIRELKLRIPEGVSVTAVTAEGLATWSFDPEQRLLEAILEKPVTGDFSVTVMTQRACEGIPYDVVLGVPEVLGASRQRGAVALAAPDTVQVRVENAEGLHPMNIEDFSAVATNTRPSADRSAVTIRKAFRYHQAEAVSVAVHTERVLPEIRVVETASLSIGDERIVLSSRLELIVAKAGIFSVSIGIPADYDVETLTGRDVSHWDEVKEEGGRGVVVHFNRRVADSTELNLVVARTEKGIEESISVPRVAVEAARKHHGKLTVSGERGVRLMVENHRGVDVKKASEEGISRTGVLVFDILRPSWNINLKTEVMAPLVKPEVVQWVDLAEGMLQCRVFVRYRIENAGVKSFLLQSPVPGVTLTVAGGHVARVHEVDADKGLWQVDLHGKVENLYALTVSYQVPYAPEDRKVSILPLQTVDTEPQRGYLAVTCAGRVQVEPTGSLEGLKVEDPRNVPSEFGAGDLSGAILCYRTVRKEYKLDLSVVRHDSADVLPASVNQVRMTSVVSTSGRMLTRVAADMSVADLRFLKVELPNPEDRLWTVLVNGREVATSRDGLLYCIPLEEQEGAQSTTVDMVYAGSSSRGGFWREQSFEAPKFTDLPMDDIQWKFFVPHGRRYYGFGGTMEHLEPGYSALKVFDTRQYAEWNKEQREASIQKARQVLDAGEALLRSGKQRSAKKAFQQAMSYSQGQADLNEDARVQLRNLVKQQVKIGLVNRRDALRVSRNIQDEQQTAQQTEGFQDGEYSQEYAVNIEKSLSEKDNTALEIVANKMIDQQAAAAGVVTAIRITMPKHGQELDFSRALQIDPAGDLVVTMKVGNGRLGRFLGGLWPCAVVFVILWAALAARRSARLAKA